MDVIELTKKLISIESITGNEEEIEEYIASNLEFASVELQEVAGFGPNICAKNITDPKKPIIILNCHMDTVEVMQGWESDPLSPKVVDKRIFGLGACDMKAGIAISMDVFKKAVRSDVNIIFTAVSDEEGNSTGSFVLLKKLKKELGDQIKNGLCLIPEDTDEKVKLGARGRYVIEISVLGTSAHGATPEFGISAISDAAKIAGAIDNLPTKFHPKLGNGSKCVLKIEGGGDSLSVPDKCTIRVDRHTVVAEDKTQVMKDMENLLKDLDLKCSFELSLMNRKTPFLEPYILEENSDWALKFLSEYRKFFDEEPSVGYGKSVGDFNAFGKLMPTIVYGPSGENAHGPNECVFMDSIIRCRDFYLDLLKGI